MILYHITPEANLQSIKERGLVPSIGPRSKAAGETTGAVYLFGSLEDAEDALTNWLGEEFPDQDLVLLAVETEAAKKEEGQFEYFSETVIPPENIFECLNFYNCIFLLRDCVNAGLIKKTKDSCILVFRSAGEKEPEGWYEENLMSVASELRTDIQGQRTLIKALEEKGIKFVKQTDKFPL